MIKENNDYQKYKSAVEQNNKESPTRSPTYSPTGAPTSGCVSCGLDLLSPGISKAEIENSPSYQLINGTAKKPGMQYADDPCTPKPNGTFQYPNLNQYIKDYLRTTPINENCIINLLFHPTLTYPPPLYLPEPIRVDLRECCNALTKSIWCAKRGDVEAIESAYDAFKKCVEKKINNAIDDFYRNHPDIYQAFPIQLHEQIQEIYRKIEDDKIDYTNRVKNGDGYLPHSTGNKDSCICGGDVPTICCQPYEVDEYGNYKRDEQGNFIKLKECWCLDGALKNLCIEDCMKHKAMVIVQNNKEIIDKQINDKSKKMAHIIKKYYSQSYEMVDDGVFYDEAIDHLNTKDGFVYNLLGRNYDVSSYLCGITLTKPNEDFFELKDIWLLFIHLRHCEKEGFENVIKNGFLLILAKEDKAFYIAVRDYKTFIDFINNLIDKLDLKSESNEVTMAKIIGHIEKMINEIKDKNNISYKKAFIELFDMYFNFGEFERG